jgi:large subunit ribosomal protein L15
MLQDILGATPRYKRPLRKGRGESSGHGKTSGRGTKGSGARGGKPHWKPGHEGGQTPLHRRLPTRGFSNDKFARDWYVVNVGALSAFDEGATVDAAALVKAGLVPDAKVGVKILGDGDLTKKLTVVAGWYSKSAVEKITKAGGVVQNAKGGAFEFPKPKKKFVPKAADKAKKSKAAQPATPEASGGEAKPA